MGLSSAESAPELERVFPGNSEMARRMRALDWSATALGPPRFWPDNLRTSLSLCLTSRFPIIIWWGPTLSILYNDAYIPFLGEAKHPRYLGRPGRECWQEIWGAIGPMLEGVLRTGEATWSDDYLFFFERRLPREEVYVTFTYGPIMGADGRTVEGVFCPCTETTERVVGARRLETLCELGVKALETRTVDAACEEAARVLAENPFDIPFAAVYLVDADGTQADLKSLAGFPADVRPFPTTVSLSDGDTSPWPLASVLRGRRAAKSADLAAAGVPLPGGAWPEAASRALVLPVFGAKHEGLSGIVVLGVSPRRVLDDAYRTFFDLIASHVGRAISDAMAYEAEQKRAEALAEIDRAKTVFFSNVSHEFRAPLTLAATALRESEERFRHMADHAPVIIWVTEPDGTCSFLSKSFYEFTGQNPEDGLGFGWTEAVHPEDHGRTVVTFLAANERRKPFRLDYRLRRKDGQYRWAIDTAVPRFSSGGKFLGYIGSVIDITERKQMEEELKKREAQLSEAQCLAHVGSWEWDTATDTVTWSDELYRICGVDPQDFEATYEAVLRLIHPDDREHFESLVRRARLEHEPYDFEHRVVHPDGEVRVLQSRVAVVVDEGGRVVRLSGTGLDITERKRIEEALRERERFIRHISELSPVMLDVYDLATGSHPYFSSDVRDLLGYTANEIGKMEDEFSVLVCPEDLPRLGENIERLKRLKDGEINEFECRVRRGDGELRWVMARSMVFARNGRGEVQQVVNATLDITERKRAEEALRRAHDELEGRVAKRTRQLSASNEELLKEIGERKRAEEALRESEARFRSYFELGLIGMAITSPTKGILEANDELCRTLGYEREELLQMTWAELTHPDDLAADGAKFELVIAGVMDGYMLDKRWIRKDGCVIDTIMSAKCLRRADGSVDYCVGLILETTERRRAEEERTQILQRLIGVQEEERRRIAREMHDEFGQQLTALILQLGMLKGDCGNGQEVRARLESLEASARQLDREVEFLVWKLRPTALDDLGLRAALERHARNWSATFGVPCEVHVRGMGRERLASEVETTLYRVAQEALNNVAKYARASNVGVVLARDDGQVSLIVEDDGVGFEVEKTQGGKGGGFGLIGMRERAALVGGTVEVESRSGGGTTVYVRIPARETTVEERAE